MTFKAILQALERGEAKIYRCYTKFSDFYSEKCNKICSSPNLESDLQMRIKVILRWGSWFLLINKLQPKIIYICPDR